MQARLGTFCRPFEYSGLTHSVTAGRRNGGGGGGGRGASAPPLRKQGGLSPPILSYAHTIKLQQHSSGCLQKSPQVKIATKSVQKLLPECIRNTLRESKFPKFSGGAYPQTPLGGLWANAHSLTIVTVHSQKSEPPPPLWLPVLRPWTVLWPINTCRGISAFGTLPPQGYMFQTLPLSSRALEGLGTRLS